MTKKRFIELVAEEMASAASMAGSEHPDVMDAARKRSEAVAKALHTILDMQPAGFLKSETSRQDLDRLDQLYLEDSANARDEDGEPYDD